MDNKSTHLSKKIISSVAKKRKYFISKRIIVAALSHGLNKDCFNDMKVLLLIQILKIMQ